MEVEEIDIHAIRFLTSEGGTLMSSARPDITCTLPEGALTVGKKGYCRVSLQVITMDPTLVHKNMGKDAFVSPIVVIEPVRRKFHKALTKTLPVPGFAHKKVDKKNVRILFSITGTGENSDWKDITTSVAEHAVSKAVETGYISIDTVVSGRYAVVCCENSIMDVPETMTEMVRCCTEGRCNDQPHLDLLHAANTGDLPALKTCIASEGVDINYANKSGQTALHLACKQGHLHITQTLLENKADVTLMSTRGNAAIHLACFHGHKAIVELLLDHDCDVNLPSKDSGFPPIYAAILETHCDTVRLLLSRGSDFSWTSPDGLSLILVAVFCTYDKEKTAALLHVLLEEVSLAQLELSKTLKDKGFESHGEALMYSVSSRQASKDLIVAVRSKLANYSLDLLQEDMKSCEDTYGEFRTFIEASTRGNVERVSILSDKAYMINKITERSVSCLHCACQNDNVQNVEILIKAGADVNRQTRGGFSCLYIAAAGGHTGVVKTLLKNGANTDTLNQFGLSANDIALEMGLVNIADIIKDYIVKNEYKRENEAQNNNQPPAKKDIDDKAVKKCCTVL